MAYPPLVIVEIIHRRVNTVGRYMCFYFLVRNVLYAIFFSLFLFLYFPFCLCASAMPVL
jgi:hypothetical protein